MKKKILIIEDDLPTIDIYETILAKEGFEVEVLTTGLRAFEKVDKLNQSDEKLPDLVFLDIILPDVNGIDILKKMREGEKTKTLPVFILTNYTDSELERMGYKLNTEKYILKADCTPSKLVPMVKERLGVK